MHSSLIFTRSRLPLLDKPIRAWTGGEAGHVGVGIGSHVIDTTFRHGCRAWSRTEWLSHRTLVDEVEVVPITERAGNDAGTFQ